MGDLISVIEFTGGEDAWKKVHRFPLRDFDWYFPEEVTVRDANYNRSRDWDATILLAYPEKLAIHLDDFDGALKVKLRRFVRDQCEGDVIFREEDHSYKYLHRYTDHNNRKAAYRNKVKHGYIVFYFETVHDAVKFGLVFSGLVRPIEKRHHDPAKRVDEAMVQDAIDNPHRLYEENGQYW